MTGPPGSPADLGAILQKARQAREEVERARASLRERRVDGQAGGGMVTATCDGTGELVRLRFEPGLLAREDLSLVEDLVVAAVRDARRRASDLERETMGGILGGLAGGFPMPPGLADLLR